MEKKENKVTTLTEEQTVEILNEHILAAMFEREAAHVIEELPNTDKTSFILGLVAGARINSEHSLMVMFPNNPESRAILRRELTALDKERMKKVEAACETHCIDCKPHDSANCEESSAVIPLLEQSIRLLRSDLKDSAKEMIKYALFQLDKEV